MSLVDELVGNFWIVCRFPSLTNWYNLCFFSAVWEVVVLNTFVVAVIRMFHFAHCLVL